MRMELWQWWGGGVVDEEVVVVAFVAIICLFS
jgi:hypothetical protein